VVLAVLIAGCAQAAVVSGQYTHADGLFYGGHEPVCSNRNWHRIIEQHLQGFTRVALIDFHTGLGPSGYGEPIYIGTPGSAGETRARHWYGDVDSELGRQIQRTSKDTFCPSSPKWQSQILERSEYIIRSALEGLSA